MTRAQFENAQNLPTGIYPIEGDNNDLTVISADMVSYGNGTVKDALDEGTGGGVADVEVNGSSVVNAQGIAEITIPDELSDLTDDSTHRTVTDTEKSTWNSKVSDNPTFTEAQTRTNILSGESFATILGKIKKWFAGLKTVAFSGSYSDLSNTPTKVSDFTNDSGFVTSTVNNLANYYLKSETYTQAQVDALIGAISTISIEVVQTLPTQDIKTNTIYFVPKQTAGTQNVYDEYIYVNNAWELIGDTEIDLSNYVTTTDLATVLQDYVTSTGLSTILANYYTSSQIDTLLGGKVNDVEVNGTSVVNGQGVAEVTVPDDLADLADDSTHRTVTDTEKSTWSAKVSDNPTFTEASTRANIASGESFTTILGKIKKFFTDLKTVAFTGSYNDLSNKPTIPAAQVNSDWNANSGVAQILNKPTIPDVSGKLNRNGDTITGNLNIGSNGGGGYLNASATNGGCNSIMIGDDVWLGDDNMDGLLGMKAATGANCGFRFRNASGAVIGKLQSDAGVLTFNDNTIVDASNHSSVLGPTYLTKSGGTMTGNLIIEKSGETYFKAVNTDKQVGAYLDSDTNADHGVWSNGYNNGSFQSSGRWLLKRDTSGDVYVNNTKVPYNGGTLALTSNTVSKSGDTMTGQLKLASTGFRTASDNGYALDQYGNFKQITNSGDTDSFGFINSNGNSTVTIYWNSGNINAKGNIDAKAFNGISIKYFETNDENHLDIGFTDDSISGNSQGFLKVIGDSNTRGTDFIFPLHDGTWGSPVGNWGTVNPTIQSIGHVTGITYYRIAIQSWSHVYIITNWKFAN